MQKRKIDFSAFLKKLRPSPILISEESLNFRRAKFIRNSSLVFMSFMVFYCIYEAILHNTAIVIAECLCAILLYLICYNLRDSKAVKRASLLLIIILYGMMAVSLIFGKKQSYSLIWMVLAPLITYYLVGSKTGLKISAGFIVLLFADLVFMPRRLISFNSLSNIIYSLISLVMIMFYYEKSPEVTQKTLEDKQQQLFKASTTDGLTKLCNRMFIDQSIEERFDHISALSPDSDTAWSLVLIDIDHFKNVNDRFGHQQGNEALKAVAAALLNNFEAFGPVARWGGEEFLVSLFDVPSEKAIEMPENARSCIEQIKFEKAAKITISLGLVSYQKGILMTRY